MKLRSAKYIFSWFQTLMYLRLFAHILVGFLIGALYYDIGNDGAKVLSNLGFLFFNMLFLMYTSMTITILSCKYICVIEICDILKDELVFQTKKHFGSKR